MLLQGRTYIHTWGTTNGQYVKYWLLYFLAQNVQRLQLPSPVLVYSISDVTAMPCNVAVQWVSGGYSADSGEIQ